MRSKIVYLMAAGLALATVSTSSQSASAKYMHNMYKDNTNTYFTSATPLTVTSTFTPSSTSTEILQGTQQRVIESPVVFAGNCARSSKATLIETQVSSPVLVQSTNTMPITVEDRVVKAHHLFKIALWPIFNFSIK